MYPWGSRTNADIYTGMRHFVCSYVDSISTQWTWVILWDYIVMWNSTIILNFVMWSVLSVHVLAHKTFYTNSPFPLHILCCTTVFILQGEVLCILKEASRLNPDLLQKQVEDVKHKHREDRSVCMHTRTYVHACIYMCPYYDLWLSTFNFSTFGCHGRTFS